MYIKSIDVKGLWSELDLHWDITSQVNILSGSNGSGKSTILRCLGDMFRDGNLSHRCQKLVDKITVQFSNGDVVDSVKQFDFRKYNVNVLSTFDMTLRESEAVSKLSNGDVVTELDWELFRLHTAYLDYQLEVSKEIIEALTAGNPTDEIIAQKRLYYDTIDSLFVSTGKKIDRQSNSLGFVMGCRRITPYQLSSGEKQMLIILTSALINGRHESIMIMDEPEISLHFDWQRRLIEDIMTLNPKMQVIIATHSPAVVMNGWIDRVSEISELVTSRSE